MEFFRLNGDTSWLICCEGNSLAIDPWLLGAEVDCCPCFNSARLLSGAADPLQLAPTLTGILITQPFSDHCHEGTLLALGCGVPIFAVPGALARLRQGPTPLAARVLPLSSVASRLPGWRAEHIAPSFFSPTHGGVLLSTQRGSVVFAPHGLKAAGLRLLASRIAPVIPRPITVVSTTTVFDLPCWLGGKVNLGLSSAVALCEAVRADAFIATHDEDKPSTGCIPLVASKHYCSEEEVRKAIPVAIAGPPLWSKEKALGQRLPLPVFHVIPTTSGYPPHSPPLPQLSLRDGLREACGTAYMLRALAESTPPPLTSSSHQQRDGSSVSVGRFWNTDASTYTYHTRVSVPVPVWGKECSSSSSRSGSRGVLQAVSELFFRAYELPSHGWYKQFKQGAVTTPPRQSTGHFRLHGWGKSNSPGAHC